MKYSECNPRQKKAYLNILYAANWIIGGLENEMQDNEEGSAEYKEAAEALKNHDLLVEMVYHDAITDVYSGDGVYFGPDAQKILKDVRFCGKDWLMARCEARVKKCGY